MARALFVDFENVQKLEFAQIPADVRVFWFFGANQTKVPTSMLTAAATHPGGFVPIQAAASGRDALDFLLAFQLGAELTRDPALECTIYSEDGGFDPLIKHLRKLGHTVTKMKPRRAPKAKPAAPARYEEALKLLSKAVKNRPGTRAKLVKHLCAQMQKLEPKESEAIVEHLLRQGVTLAGKNDALTYALPGPAAR